MEALSMQTIYADGIANITLIEGVVRLELINLTQVEKDKATVRPVAAIAMSIPALMRTQEQLNGLIGKLVEQGVLQKRDDKPLVAAAEK